MNTICIITQAKVGYGLFFMDYFEKAGFYISSLVKGGVCIEARHPVRYTIHGEGIG